MEHVFPQRGARGGCPSAPPRKHCKSDASLKAYPCTINDGESSGVGPKPSGPNANLGNPLALFFPLWRGGGREGPSWKTLQVGILGRGCPGVRKARGIQWWHSQTERNQARVPRMARAPAPYGRRSQEGFSKNIASRKKTWHMYRMASAKRKALVKLPAKTSQK